MTFFKPHREENQVNCASGSNLEIPKEPEPSGDLVTGAVQEQPLLKFFSKSMSKPSLVPEHEESKGAEKMSEGLESFKDACFEDPSQP